MTDQIASITLRADVSDLKTASNELDKLGGRRPVPSARLMT